MLMPYLSLLSIGRHRVDTLEERKTEQCKETRRKYMESFKHMTGCDSHRLVNASQKSSFSFSKREKINLELNTKEI